VLQDIKIYNYISDFLLIPTSQE